MKNAFRKILFLSALFAASVLYAASAPTVDIAVRQKAGRKIVKRVTTDSNGYFTLGTLPAGDYTLEFRAPKSTDLKNQQFSIAIDGTKTSGTQGGVSGKYLTGGVALDVEMVAGKKVSGQVTTGPMAAVTNTKKKMVWVPQEIGSNLPGHWAEEGSAQTVTSRNWGHIKIDDMRKMQDHNDL